MFLELKRLIDPAEVARLRVIASRINFVDGRASNPHNIAKQNTQADLGDPLHAESSQIVAAALGRSHEFLDFAMPKRIAPPMLARYSPNMHYGPHSDSAFMPIPGMPTPLRSDISLTVFLSDPHTYQGGELAVHLGTRPVLFKGGLGDAIVYPSTTLHEVKPVLSGERLVAITFIESLVADQEKRDMLYELNEVAALEGLKMNWENRTRLEAVRNNLTRLWSAGS
jgi:PKHD-type hydroxylase